jgi:hypothetical protein
MTSRLRARAAAVAGLVPLVLLLGCLGLVAANTWLSLVMPVDRPGWAEVRGRVERPGWYLIFTKQWMRDGSGKIRAMPKQHLDLFK